MKTTLELNPQTETLACLKCQPASCSLFHLPPSCLFCADRNKVLVCVPQTPMTGPQICIVGCAPQWTNELKCVNTCESSRAAPDLQCFQTRAEHITCCPVTQHFQEQHGAFPAASVLHMPPAWGPLHWQWIVVVLCSSLHFWGCFYGLFNAPD